MAKQQRMGWWFFCLACVVVMVCIAQRMAVMHDVQGETTSVVRFVQPLTSPEDHVSPVTPCLLSAASLLAAPPVVLEGEIVAFCLLLALLAPAPSMRRSYSSPRAISLSGLRVHLLLCVFRE
ncbi:copper resistance protein [Enterobacter ludwigii]